MGNTNATATTVLLCGVGGQGTILAADLLARAATEAGYVAKVSEIHGMAQRGGSVTTVVRFGEKVDSMVCDLGGADVIVSFETTEALRALPFLKQDGSLVVSDESIKPLPVLTAKASMPAHAREDLAELGALLVPTDDIAAEAGNPKTGNVVLLGALSAHLDFPEPCWLDVIERRVPPKTIEANKRAFELGRAYAKKGE